MDKEEIKSEREALGLTQKHFAELLGFNIRTIQKWESGEIVEIPKKTVARIKGTLLTLGLIKKI